VENDAGSRPLFTKKTSKSPLQSIREKCIRSCRTLFKINLVLAIKK